MNSAMLVIGASAALLGAAVHGAAGDFLVVRKLSVDTLPATTFGGPKRTKLMIRVAWHMATVGLVTVAVAALLAGTVLEGDTAQGFGLLAAASSTGFAIVALGLLAANRETPWLLVRHPGPPLLIAIPTLMWLGAA